MKAQVICKHATKEQLQDVVDRFGIEDKVRQRTNHVVIELDVDDRTSDILTACRGRAYSYFRLVEWERGGGLERTGDATCVAGIQGQPLKPIVLAIKGERANLEHALFGSRNGLTIVRVWRQDKRFAVDLSRYVIREFRVQPPETLVDQEFTGAPREWLEQLHTAQIQLDKFIPVVRSALRKAECLFCTHCHYYEISEGQEEDV